VNLLRALALFLALLAVPVAAQAKCDDPRESTRVALVIGNGTYLPGQWQTLANARSDADAVCEGFAGQGFRVILVQDADRDAMAAAIARFAALAPKADVALFYFAGHGFEYAGINWLVPVDAPVETARAWLKDQYVDLASVLNAVKQAKHGLVFLDACRTRDPVVRIRDADPLGPDGPAGTINLPGDFEGVVFYSTARGASAFDAAPVTARNSPFAAAVVERLAIPDLELMRYFAFVRSDVKRRTTSENGGPQIPTTYGFLSDPLYFNQPPARDAEMDEMICALAGECGGGDPEVQQSGRISGTRGFKLGKPSTPRPAATRPTAGAARPAPIPPVAAPPSPAPGPIASLTDRMAGLDPGKARGVLAGLDKETLAKEDEPQIIARVLGQADAGSLAALAESGDPTAQYLYGAMLYLGLGVSKDLPAARAMLEKAAASGSAAGMLEYGYFLENYGDRPDDKAAGNALYERAAATGYGKAQAHLAYRLWNSAPPQQDKPRALSLWSAAAAQGYPYAIYATAVYGGRMEEARTRLADLAAKGDRAGDSWLCELAEYQGAMGKAFGNCLAAAQDGFPGAMALAARAYAGGEGVTVSRKEAEYWARLALSQPDFDDPYRRPATEALLAQLAGAK